MKKLILLGNLIMFSLVCYSQPFESKPEWENYFKENVSSLDPIEGIWNVIMTPTMTDRISGRIIGEDQTISFIAAIYKTSTGFKTYLFDRTLNWFLTFDKASNKRLYFYKETVNNTNTNNSSNVRLNDDGTMAFEFSYSEEFKQKIFQQASPDVLAQMKMHVKYHWSKSYPLEADIVKAQPSSGTGFALTKEGIIVTNYHIIENANTITVKGLNGDFNKSYRAVSLLNDIKNDIALLKIRDPEFTTLKEIPYSFKRELTEVGESVYVLGYPLRATMGDEIKLTNGIISSKSGFQGDITCYQISAPVQPGNSGGPLFDSYGTLVGIVNAKHLAAESVSYAIKSSYLYNLLESSDTPIYLTTDNKIKDTNLANQVKIIKEFIFIIEAK